MDKPKPKAGAETSSAVSPPANTTSRWWQQWLIGCLLVMLTVMTYLPALRAGFIWDDDQHLTQNPCIVGPLGLKEIWTTSAARICPLVLSSFWVQYKLWGPRPLPFHMITLLMHAAAAVVLWQVLRILKVRGSWLGAALWALHPVNVESVAWITELKNTQSGLFFILTIFFFTNARLAGQASEGKRAKRNDAWAFVCAAMAMASKSSTVVLPLVLGLCSWWVRGRWCWRNVLRLAPFFVLSAAASALSMWTQRLEGAIDPEWMRGWPERIITAGKVVWFYLGKLFWPHPLIFIYPRWEVNTGRVLSYVPALGAVMMLVVLWWQRERRARGVFLAFTYFLVVLLPVLGLVEHFFLRYSFVGDHFQYLASVGPLAFTASVMTALLAEKYPMLLRTLGGILLGVLGTLSWQHAHIFHDEGTLWRDTLAKNPASWMSYNNLGVAMKEAGRNKAAEDAFRESVRLNPRNADALNGLGAVLFSQHKVDEAIKQYRLALTQNSYQIAAMNNLAVALSSQKHFAEAITYYEQALRLRPHDTSVRINFAKTLVDMGHTDEGIAKFQEAIQLEPNNAEAHISLGQILEVQGKTAAAVGHFQTALRLGAKEADLHFHLGKNLASLGRMTEAVSEYEAALRANPTNLETKNQLGAALTGLGRVDEAIVQFRELLGAKPDYAQAHDNLGVALASRGQLVEAEAELRTAIRYDAGHADTYFNLGNVLALRNDYAGAIEQYHKALEISPDHLQSHNNMGHALVSLGRRAEAMEQFRAVLRLAPGNAEAKESLRNLGVLGVE